MVRSRSDVLLRACPKNDSNLGSTSILLHKKKRNTVPLSCKFVTDYRTFMKDFLKVVDFLHYLKAEGYDMVTFDKVGNGIKI